MKMPTIVRNPVNNEKNELYYFTAPTLGELASNEKNELYYFTAPTLGELASAVNNAIAAFEAQTNDEARFTALPLSDVQYLNGEYVQTVHFDSWTRSRRPVRRATKKKTAKAKTAATETTPTA